MQREIKFRAWDVSGEKPYMLGPYDLTDSIFNHKDIRLLPLMQFTGLKDKNGKEIYDGDIVNCIDHPTGYDNVVGSVYWNVGKWSVTYSMVQLCDYGSAWVEVIGNIYENQELLNP